MSAKHNPGRGSMLGEPLSVPRGYLIPIQLSAEIRPPPRPIK